MNKEDAIKSLAKKLDEWFGDPSNTLNETGSIDIGYLPDDASMRIAGIVVDILLYSSEACEMAQQ